MRVMYSVGTVEVELDVRPLSPCFPKSSSPPPSSPPSSSSLTFPLSHSHPPQPPCLTQNWRMLISERPTLDRPPPYLPTRLDFDGVLDVDHHFSQRYVHPILISSSPTFLLSALFFHFLSPACLKDHSLAAIYILPLPLTRTRSRYRSRR